MNIYEIGLLDNLEYYNLNHRGRLTVDRSEGLTQRIIKYNGRDLLCCPDTVAAYYAVVAINNYLEVTKK